MVTHLRRIPALAALVAALAAIPAAANPFAVTTVSPASQSGAVGSAFTVDVVMQDPAGDIAPDSVSVLYSFDPAILQATSVSTGVGSPFTNVGANTIDNTLGTVLYAAGGPGSDNFTATIATIAFQGVGPGTSAVSPATIQEFEAGSLYGINGLASGASIDVVGPTPGNLIVNGSFETGPGGNLTVGSTGIAPWDVVSGDVDQIAGLWPGAAAGYSLDMNGFGPGAIEQTFATTAGQAYVVSFQLGANGSGVRTLRVSAAGTTQDYSYENTSFPGDPVGWTGRSFVFVATGASTTLNFSSLTGGAAGPTLDVVDVQAAPAVPSAVLANGSFEDAVTTGGVIGAGNAGEIAPWTLLSGDLDLVSVTPWTAPDGAWSIDLNGFNPAAIEQTVTTVPGQSYELSFQLGDNNGGGSSTVRVSAAGTTEDYTYDNVALPGVGWTPRTFTFVATGASTTLSLSSLTAGAGGPTLDNLVLSPSPTVWAPHVLATYNQLLTVPIAISDATGIVSTEVTVEYDTDLLTFTGVNGTGTLSDPGAPDEWAIEYNTEAGAGSLERVRIATAVSQSSASGPQALINVSFAVRDQPRVPDFSALALLDVLLNDGVPGNTTSDGSVTLGGNDGSIESLPATFIPREDLTVTVVDLDEDADGVANTDQVSVTATNLANGDVVSLTLPEDAATAGTFALVVSTEFGLAAVADGVIQAQAGDVIEFAFSDALDGAGAGPIVRTAQSTAIGGADGEVLITRATQPGDVIYVRVDDADLNLDAGVQETALVVVTSTNGESEAVTVTEIDVDDEVFFGTLNSAAGASAGTDDDGTVNAAKGDLLTATYDDVVTAVGSQVDRTDDDQVVDPFGDADGNGLSQAFDAAQVLLHVLAAHIVDPLLLIQANVDLDAWATGITPFDASLILQRRVGLIGVFPVQTALSDNHPQPLAASPKVATEARLLALDAGDGYLALNVDDRAGVLSGDLLLRGVERAELAPELSEFLIAQRATDEGLRVVFAGARALDGGGEVLRLFGSDLSGVRLESAELNDGGIEAQVAGARPFAAPQATALHGNWPNPFNPETTISFDLAQAEQVRLEVYDALGQKVKTLVSESMSAGAHQILWRGVNESGQAVSSGVYFYRLQAGSHLQMQRMLLLK